VAARYLVLACLLLCACGAEATKRPATFCDVVAKALALNGKVVAVEADLQAGPHDDVLLADARCPHAYVSLGFAPGVLERADVNRLVSGTVAGYPQVEHRVPVTVRGKLLANDRPGSLVTIVVETIEPRP